MISIYHNPRCSKSRETLALVEEFAARNHIQIEVVEYLKTPLTMEQLAAIRQMLGSAAGDMIRSNEEEFAELCLAQAGEAAVLRAVAAHPKLLQRPIVVYRGRAAIGRPPELVLDLLNAD